MPQNTSLGDATDANNRLGHETALGLASQVTRLIELILQGTDIVLTIAV